MYTRALRISTIRGVGMLRSHQPLESNLFVKTDHEAEVFDYKVGVSTFERLKSRKRLFFWPRSSE